MKSYQTFAVTQHPHWACPGMLVFVADGKIIGQQVNPGNSLTQEWAEDGEDWGEWNPSEYVAYRQV